MEATMNLDGWEVLLGSDADLAAFLSDADASVPDERMVVPAAANDNWRVVLTDERQPSCWRPRFRTVE